MSENGQKKYFDQLSSTAKTWSKYKTLLRTEQISAIQKSTHSVFGSPLHPVFGFPDFIYHVTNYGSSSSAKDFLKRKKINLKSRLRVNI